MEGNKEDAMAVNDDLTEARVEEFFSTLSDWGKWGANDQLGALNSNYA